jgi:predicted transposase YdaD
MAQTDKAIRRLVDLSQAGIVTSLLAPAKVQILGIEPSELQVVERITDKVIHAKIDGVETIINVEFQASHDEAFPTRLLAYHALLRQSHAPTPVRSVVVYLMHEPPPGGVPRGIAPSPGDLQLAFSYDVFCAWERPISLDQVRDNPHLGPLAALTPGVAAGDLTELQRIIERAPQPRVVRGELLVLTYILARRRFDKPLLQSLLRSNIMLEDSPGYQELMAQGEAQGEARGEARGRKAGEKVGEKVGEMKTLRRKIVVLVRLRLDDVPDELSERLEALDENKLDRLFDRLLEAMDAAAVKAALELDGL